jgi:hypothetical protein
MTTVSVDVGGHIGKTAGLLSVERGVRLSGHGLSGLGDFGKVLHEGNNAGRRTKDHENRAGEGKVGQFDPVTFGIFGTVVERGVISEFGQVGNIHYTHQGAVGKGSLGDGEELGEGVPLEGVHTGKEL